MTGYNCKACKTENAKPVECQSLICQKQGCTACFVVSNDDLRRCPACAEIHQREFDIATQKKPLSVRV